MWPATRSSGLVTHLNILDVWQQFELFGAQVEEEPLGASLFKVGKLGQQFNLIFERQLSRITESDECRCCRVNGARRFTLCSMMAPGIS